VSTIASFPITTADTQQGGLITKSRAIPPGYGSLKRDLKSFITLGKTSRKARLQNTQLWAGFLFLTPGGKVLACFLPHFVEDAGGKKIIVGTRSNNPSKPVPMILPYEILDHIMVICPKSLAPTDTVWGAKAIDPNDTTIAALLPTTREWTDCYIGRLPAVITIPYGTDEVIAGKATDQSVLDFLEDVHEDKQAALWADCLLHHHDKPLIDAIINSAAFTPYLPAMPQKHCWAPAARHLPLPPNDDDEEVSKAWSLVESDCALIVAATHGLANAISITSTNGRNPPVEIGISTPPGTHTTPGIGRTVPPATASPELKAQQRARLLIIGCDFDPHSKRIEPVPDSTLQGTILAFSSKADQATCFSSALSSIIDSMGRSRNYFNRKATLPRLEKLTLAYMATGKWHDAKLTRIDDKNMMGFALPMLLPDTPASIKAKGNLSHIFDAEDALEEVSEKRTKLSTAFTPVTSMNAIDDVLVALANLKGFFAVWFAYDLDDSTLSAPALVRYADEMADKMTSKEAKEWLSDKRGTPSEAQLAYYVLSTMQMCLTLHVLESISVIDQTYALQGDWGRVSTTQLRLASKTFTKAIENIDEVFATTLSIPSCPLWENSTEKADKDKVDHLLLKSKLGLTHAPPHPAPGQHHTAGTRPSTPNHRSTSRTPHDVTPSPSEPRPKRQKLANLGQDNTDGYLVWSGEGFNMPLPPDLNTQEFSLCKAFWRKGTKCRFGHACKRTHGSFSDLTDSQQRTLYEFVTTTDKLAFNPDLVPESTLKKVKSATGKTASA
jgi:hypothetical protein